ncbi:unnamed protein product [Rotaria sordida]|uniref:Uncharacterized protein n=1 Tax=Rotaria sordida TaxID=392033 RepID=A0A815JL36_9BILA|nr:unnamed protein product [Rotaria sordida]
MADRYRWCTNANNTGYDADDEDIGPILNDSGHHDVDRGFITRLAHYMLDMNERELTERRALDDEIAFLRDLSRRQGDEIEYLNENVRQLRILTKKMEQLLCLIVQSSS